MNFWANDPDYNTTTGIVSFPRVTVNNSTPYINAQLLLDPNGTWSILGAELEPESEPEFDLTGSWSDDSEESVGDFDPLLLCTARIEVTFIQNNNNLEGSGVYFRSCTGAVVKVVEWLLV